MNSATVIIVVVTAARDGPYDVAVGWILLMIEHRSVRLTSPGLRGMEGIGYNRQFTLPFLHKHPKVSLDTLQALLTKKRDEFRAVELLWIQLTPKVPLFVVRYHVYVRARILTIVRKIFTIWQPNRSDHQQ